jgi:hypothetical protein
VSVETASQYLHTPSVQRLLDSIISAVRMLVVRETSMDHRRDCIRTGTWRQNECTTLSSRSHGRYHDGNGSRTNRTHCRLDSTSSGRPYPIGLM